MHHIDIIKFFISLLAMCNPLTVVPIFLALSEKYSVQQRNAIVMTTCIAAVIIFIIATWAGTAILSLFGINTASFETAGGLIILSIGLNMVSGNSNPPHHDNQDQQDALKKPNIAVVPLAIPIMAGPGALTIIMINANKYNAILDKVYICIASVLLVILVGLSLYFAKYIFKLLGASGIKIASRIMGLILAAIAIEMLHNGLIVLFPGLN